MKYQQFTGDIHQLRNNPVFFFETLMENSNSILVLPQTNLFSFSTACQLTLVGSAPLYVESIFKNPDVFGNFVPEEALAVAQKSEHYRKLTASLTTVQNEDYHRKLKAAIQPAFTIKSAINSEQAILSCLACFCEELQVGQVLQVNLALQRLGLYLANRLILGIKDFRNELSLGQLFHHTRVLRLKIFSAKDEQEKQLLEQEFIKSAEITYANFYKQIDIFRADQHSYDGVLPFLANAKNGDDHYIFTHDEIINQSNVLFSSSYHPYTSLMTWAILIISTFPAVYKNLLDEIENVTPSHENIEQLTYLDFFIKELMRMLPANAIMVRKGLQATTLFDVDFPENIEVTMSPLVTHRNMDIYAAADCFMPERWQNINPEVFEYLPFGAGNRYCSGAYLATMMMKLTLVTLLKQFQFELQPQNVIDWTVNATLLPVKDITFRLLHKDKKLVSPQVNGNINKLIRFAV